MSLSSHRTTISSVLLTCLVGIAHANSHFDSVGIGGGITFRTTPDHPIQDFYVGFEVGSYVPIYAHDGEYISRAYAAATVGSGVYVYPLLTGNITSSFEPLSLSLSVNAEVSYPPSAEYRDFAFSATNSASITLTSSELKPVFSVDSELNADLSLGGSHWLGFSMPLLGYHYSSDTGTQFKTLGLELNLFSDDQNCTQLGCNYTSGFWKYSIASVPEPSSNAYAIVGLLLVGSITYFRKRQ